MEALTKEHLYINTGPEFKELEGCILIVEKALYGVRTSEARWAEKLAHSLKELGFSSSYVVSAI